MGNILLFDNGEIIDDGTHEALVAKGGHYARMWQIGFLPEIEEIKEDK